MPAAAQLRPERTEISTQGPRPRKVALHPLGREHEDRRIENQTLDFKVKTLEEIRLEKRRKDAQTGLMSQTQSKSVQEVAPAAEPLRQANSSSPVQVVQAGMSVAAQTTRSRPPPSPSKRPLSDDVTRQDSEKKIRKASLTGLDELEGLEQELGIDGKAVEELDVDKELEMILKE